MTSALAGVQAELATLAERIRGSVVEIRIEAGQVGAGIAWGRDLVLTNAHVATRERVTVVRPDRECRRGRLLLRDIGRDLALVAADRLDLGPVTLRPADRLRPGDLVFAVGHPLGVVGALSAGVVHAAGRAQAYFPPGAPGRGLDWLQLDLEVAPGNSGGPVLDVRGEVVGLTTMIAAGLTLAVPGQAAYRWATRALQAWRRSGS